MLEDEVDLHHYGFQFSAFPIRRAIVEHLVRIVFRQPSFAELLRFPFGQVREKKGDTVILRVMLLQIELRYIRQAIECRLCLLRILCLQFCLPNSQLRRLVFALFSRL